MYKLLAFIACCLISFHSVSDPSHPVRIVRTMPAQSEEDAIHQYFTQVIELALLNAKDQYGESQLVLSTEEVNQGRWMRLVITGKYLDVVWAGSSMQRENELQAIPVDLLGGVLGLRHFIIRKRDYSLFTSVNSLADLKQFKACQGQHWPDSDILESAGLPVVRTGLFSANFQMLEKQRCDYFPRGVHEGQGEIDYYQALHGNGLTLYSDLLIYYPFSMFLFVSNDNKELAEVLEYGLKKSVDNGSLLTLIKTSPATQHLYPLSKWAKIKRLELVNPIHQEHTGKYHTWLLDQMNINNH